MADMYEMKIGSMIFPLGPSSLDEKIQNSNETIILINDGEINYRKKPGLSEFSVEFVLPGHKYPFAYYPKGAFQKPSVYIAYLRSLKQNKSTFKLQIIRKDNGRCLGYNLSETVTVEDFTVKETADDGVDVTVTINFKQFRSFGSKKITYKTSKGKTSKKTEKKRPKSTKSKTVKYKVRKGDCLWNIAKKKLGKASRWKEIYKKNKSVIEKAAKKHGRKSSSNGHWIYPGTILILPKR